MILQALHDYYQRTTQSPDLSRRLPAFGNEDKEIPFILELTLEGKLAGIIDTRTGVANKKVATRFRVPKGVKKTSGVAANLLWDTAEYVLGTPDTMKLIEAQRKGKEDEYLQRLGDMHRAFKARIAALPIETLKDDGIRAVMAFIDNAAAEIAIAQPVGWADIAEINPVVTFRLVADTDLVCQRPPVLAGAGVALRARLPTQQLSA